MPTYSRTTILLATDQQRSVINALKANRPQPIAYTPFGYRPAENGFLSLLGFNGEQADTLTGHYHLGNGYRQFNPVLMRFNSPDSWSPFGEGGLNAYGYCGGDPRNKVDQTGHAWGFMKTLRRLNIVEKKTRVPAELEQYASPKNPTTPLDKKVAKQISKDFVNGKPSNEKVERREKRYWTKEALATGKKPKQLIEEAKHRHELLVKSNTLQNAEVKTTMRLANDPPETSERREVMLNLIKIDIAETRDKLRALT
jgi:RHS repeat-associated protein